MRRILFDLCAACALTLIGLVNGCGSHSSAQETWTAYVDALNSHSVDSLMQFYADSAIFEIPNLNTYLVGLEELRGLAKYDSVLNTNLKIENMQISQDTVYCSIRETNLWMDADFMASVNSC